MNNLLQKQSVTFEQTRPKLVRWLISRPWAGLENAEDLASDAYLSGLELAAEGKKTRNYYYLSKEAARKQKLLPYRVSPKNTNKPSYLSLTRDQVEQQIDFVDLSALPAPAPTAAVPDNLPETLDFINKHCCPELKKAVALILVGNTASQAAQTVGWRSDQLSRALAEVGRALSGRSRRSPKAAPNQQLGLFAAGQGV